jgi:hypothetical protein
MELNSTQQEILLLTGTKFSSRHCFEKDNDNRNLTEKEQLQEACCNGLLYEMLPEIFEPTPGNKKLYLWHIRETRSFIEIEMGELPEKKESSFSIDPYSFLPEYILS